MKKNNLFNKISEHSEQFLVYLSFLLLIIPVFFQPKLTPQEKVLIFVYVILSIFSYEAINLLKRSKRLISLMEEQVINKRKNRLTVAVLVISLDVFHMAAVLLNLLLLSSVAILWISKSINSWWPEAIHFTFVTGTISRFNAHFPFNITKAEYFISLANFILGSILVSLILAVWLKAFEEVFVFFKRNNKDTREVIQNNATTSGQVNKKDNIFVCFNLGIVALGVIISLISLWNSYQANKISQDARNISLKSQQLEFNPYIEVRFYEDVSAIGLLRRHEGIISEWMNRLEQGKCNINNLRKRYLYCEVTNHGKGKALNIRVPFVMNIYDSGLTKTKNAKPIIDEFNFWNIESGRKQKSDYSIETTYFPDYEVVKQAIQVFAIPDAGSKTDISTVETVSFQNPELEKYCK